MSQLSITYLDIADGMHHLRDKGSKAVRFPLSPRSLKVVSMPFSGVLNRDEGPRGRRVV